MVQRLVKWSTLPSGGRGSEPPYVSKRLCKTNTVNYRALVWVVTWSWQDHTHGLILNSLYREV